MKMSKECMTDSGKEAVLGTPMKYNLMEELSIKGRVVLLDYSILMAEWKDDLKQMASK
jgi:hypothetical protein